jgi:hypothetical protein
MSGRPILTLLIIASVVLFTYSSLRATVLSFVHDESLSYTIISGAPSFSGSSNDHPLNTWAMRWTSRLFGDQEWSLRLPNLISYVLYLVAGLCLLRRCDPVTCLLGSALLNLNPFLVDFFSLARGYGIAAGFSLASFSLMNEAWHRRGSSFGKVLLASAFACAGLADFSHFAWIYVHLAMLAGAAAFAVLEIAKLSRMRRLNRRGGPDSLRARAGY